MNDAPRRTLRELVARHGPGLCSDAKRCEGLLRDLCGAHRREINILVGALKERVPLDLLAGRGAMPRGLLLSRLAKRLEDQLALTEDAARWAVASWALALGVVTEAELKEAESSRVEAVAPPPPRPGAEGDAEAGKPAAQTNARPAAPPPKPRNPPPAPGRQPATPPPAHAPPPAQRRTSPPPAPAQAPPPAARANVPRASTPAARPSPAGPPSNAATTAPQQPGAGRLQPPSPEPPARRRGGRWRGCLVGCLLLILLSVLLFVGGPYVISVLREEQRQTGAETPPVQSP